MKPMRLVIACEQLWPTRIEDVFVIAVAQALTNRGHEVCLVAGVDGGVIVPTTVAFDASTDVSRLFEWKLAAYLGWHHAKIQSLSPDSVISFSPILSGDVVIPLRGLEATRAAVESKGFEHLRSLPVRLITGRRNRAKLESKLLDEQDSRYWLALNPLIELELADAPSAGQVEIQRVELPPPTIAPGAISADQRRRQLARAWGVSPDSAWFVFSMAKGGRSSGFAALMLAFKSFVKQGGQARLLLTGHCRYSDLKRIAQMGLRDRVVFIGPIENHAVLYALADLFLAIADDDVGAWAARLALGLGRPVVATTRCGAADQVRERGGVVLDVPIEPAKLASVMAQHDRVASGSRSVSPQIGLSEPLDPELYLAVVLENLLT